MPPRDELLTTGEVARRVGWSAKRMLRHLRRVNEQVGGMLLSNTSPNAAEPRYKVSWRILQALDPALFGEVETLPERVTILEVDVRTLKGVTQAQTARIRELSIANAEKDRKILRLERRLKAA